MPTHHHNHLLSLAEWADFFRLDKWHLFGFCTCEDPDAPLSSGCNCSCGGKWREFESFHTDYVSREAVSKAIAEAEAKLLRYLNFAVAPRFFANQKVNYPSGAWLGRNLEYRLATLPHRYIESFGAITESFLSTESVSITLPIVYREQVAILTVAVSSDTAADEIHIYFTLADRFNQPKDKWEITPIEVSISGGIATVQIPIYLLAQPDLTHLDPNATCMDRDDPAIYVTELEVWRQIPDPCNQGYAVGKKRCTSPPCARETQLICYDTQQSDLGSAVVIPVNCTNGALTYDRCPAIPKISEVFAHYTAGYPLENGRMAVDMQAAVAYLSASLLTCKLPYCECEPCYYKTIASMREIPKEKTGEGGAGIEGDTYRILLDSQLRPERYPLGVTWGALKAYLEIYQYQL